MLESLSCYYGPDENGARGDEELIWGKYTREQWDEMDIHERAEAIWEYWDEQDRVKGKESRQ